MTQRKELPRGPEAESILHRTHCGETKPRPNQLSFKIPISGANSPDPAQESETRTVGQRMSWRSRLYGDSNDIGTVIEVSTHFVTIEWDHTPKIRTVFNRDALQDVEVATGTD
jgi:hypothetical protein